MTQVVGSESGALRVLREQLLDLAKAFAGDSQPVGALLHGLVADVERAAAEPLEIFPVCHHSPSSAVHMLRRLRERAPRVVFVEMCEDLRPLVDDLRECRLPIALQAFAGQTDGFPVEWTPLSVVAPITAFSAEFQAISFCLENPGTELVFVDRSVDHVFQWMPRDAEKGEGSDDEEDLHGSAVGVEVGRTEPTMEAFVQFLLKNAKARHYQEWWEQYVENAILGADLQTYRQVMFLIGSLIRRLGRRDADLETDRLRERFMWTRMKRWLREHDVAPEDALYVCGAAHTASDVEEFGWASDALYDEPPRTATRWLYGLIPSSYSAIERQFHHPAGTVSLAEASWQKAIGRFGLEPFDATGRTKPKKRPPVPQAGQEGSVGAVLLEPPPPAAEDEDQLVQWCVDVVALARKNGYLASTADSIAIHQTSLLLANLRNRKHPTPWDFVDAAVTCLEKDRVPKKRDVRRLCEILLAGDRIGQVAYSSLPPLARDVYDRLAPLGVDLQARTIQRGLIDLRAHPEKAPASLLLWKLRWLFGEHNPVVRPIMGERALGRTAIQESWDIAVGKHQRQLIELGYEGVTVEQVVEKRLKKLAFGPDATTVTALEAVEASLLYLESARLTEEIGERAIVLLLEETTGEHAPEIFERVRRLVHFHRSTPEGVPGWLGRFVATGYRHYAALLPTAFAEAGTSADQLAGMLAFVFTLESLALSMGCARSQLLIAIEQAGPGTTDPEKLGLLWTAEWLLGLRQVEQIRAFFDEVLDNELRVGAFPAYVSGFLLALGFTPLVAGLAVEVMSKAFARLPQHTLLPWLPSLIVRLRPHAGTVLPALFQEAGARFPRKLADLDAWRPPWEAKPEPARVAHVERSPEEEGARRLLFAHPAAADALAAALGATGTWTEAASDAVADPAVAEDPVEAGARRLLDAFPATMDALAR